MFLAKTFKPFGRSPTCNSITVAEEEFRRLHLGIQLTGCDCSGGSFCMPQVLTHQVPDYHSAWISSSQSSRNGRFCHVMLCHLNLGASGAEINMSELYSMDSPSFP